jgi:hypothetical protein
MLDSRDRNREVSSGYWWILLLLALWPLAMNRAWLWYRRHCSTRASASGVASLLSHAC